MKAGITALAALSLAACLRGNEEPCGVDSDCAGGAICALDGVCRSVAAVEASLDTRSSVDVVSLDTASTEDATHDATGCAAVTGVFEASAEACREPTTKRTVTGLVIASQGNGLAPLSEVANQVIANGFGDGSIKLEIWIDGELRSDCPRSIAWMRGAEDRNADCTAVFSDRMPFDIPNLVMTSVDRATLDADTLVVTGLVDKAALLASMAEELRSVADALINLDVDTDGDTVADKASAIIQVQLAE